MFTFMCGGKLQNYVEIDQGKNFFFLFDTCHFIKAIRSNWLNQVSTNQNFFYPDLNNLKQINVASLQH